MNNKNNNRIWEKSGKRTENTPTLFYISLLSDIRMKYRTSQYQRFSNKKEKYQARVVSKNGKQKSIKKEIRTKELNLCPYISVLL